MSTNQHAGLSAESRALWLGGAQVQFRRTFSRMNQDSIKRPNDEPQNGQQMKWASRHLAVIVVVVMLLSLFGKKQPLFARTLCVCAGGRPAGRRRRTWRARAGPPAVWRHAGRTQSIILVNFVRSSCAAADAAETI